MSSVHSVVVWCALAALSIGLLGQSNGCNLDALINVNLIPSGGAGNSNDDGVSDDPDDNSGTTGGVEVRLNATLTGSGSPHGNAEYRREAGRTRLKVELEDAPVGSMHDVTVADVSIGTFTIGPLGEGELEFDTHVEPDHLPWPANLPTELQAGTTVQVGPASGVLGM